MKKIITKILAVVLVATMMTETVSATTSSEVKKQQEAVKSNLNSINNKISSLESQKSALQSEINALDAELVNLLVELEVLEYDMENKQLEINQAQADYQIAKENEEVQYEAMKKRIQYMYENGNTMYIEAFINSESISDLISKTELVNQLYDYDRDLLTEFQEIKEEVAALELALQEEMEEMEQMEAEYVARQEVLETTIDKKEQEVSNFSSQLASAKAKAKEYQNTIKQQTEQIKKLQAAEQKAAEEAKRKEAERKAAESKAVENKTVASAASESSSSSSDNSTNTSTGSSSGKGSQIASFACQFVGNPYVYGGTSLTNGADCSGFTQSVFANFGISIPRSSGAQASGGRSVSFSDIQPGDIVCYAGHVAIYIGNGSIVHASTAATGIKYGSVTYRTILSVRRYW